jgi:L-threonylcarbamoyladenylate synthase
VVVYHVVIPVYSDRFDETIVSLLKKGGIGVVRTDTLYGLVALATNEAAVERIFAIKGRHDTKSPIVLISNMDQLFDPIDNNTKEQLKEFWPGKNSVILPSHRAPGWITRGNQSVAYRLPDSTVLQELIDQVGPIVAPSANPQGEKPAMTIEEAKDYFGDNVDFYVDGGIVTDETPSKLLRLGADGVERLR